MTKTLILEHLGKYKSALPQDVFKFLYQSTFGCEHMVTSADAVIACIKREAESLGESDGTLTEPLDGEFSRVHLSYLSKGLSAETLGKLFYLSADGKTGDNSTLLEKINEVSALAKADKLPFSEEQYNKALEEWKNQGFSPIHHSESFRNSYKPAYRVIRNKYAAFLPLFAKIDSMLKNGNVRLAIEGGSAGGKSTLGGILEKVYDCNVFHMDDFFLRPEQRTEERLSEIGGNVDRERFLKEVLEPLTNSENVYYRRFDCATQELLPAVEVTPKKFTVTEGAYCMHPELSCFYNLSVFLDITPVCQKERIIKRNSPDFAEKFFNLWIPMENRYFDSMDVKNRCDMVISVE